MDRDDVPSIAPGAGRPKAVRMGNLYAIVQRHMDKYGVREAELARRFGTKPQTINSWKNRGVKALPTRELMERVAEVTQTPYEDVLEAALRDAGYVRLSDQALSVVDDKVPDEIAAHEEEGSISGEQGQPEDA